MWKRRIKIAGIALGTTYALGVAAVALGYRSFLYPAKHDDLEPISSIAPIVRIERPGTPVVFALHAPAPEGAPTIVCFHGNGEDLVDEVPTVHRLHALGVGVLAVEYPGYGLARDQRASEDSLYAAAGAAIAWLRDRGVPRERTVVMGFSLGSGVAAEMAHRGLASRLVLLAPYTSIPAMVSRFAPVFPTTLVVGDRFDTLAKAPSIDVPALVIHGSADSLSPVAMGERVASALPHATLHVVGGAHHNDLYARDPKLYELVARFARGEE